MTVGWGQQVEGVLMGVRKPLKSKNGSRVRVWEEVRQGEKGLLGHVGAMQSHEAACKVM
jgi:hypothetical protein